MKRTWDTAEGRWSFEIEWNEDKERGRHGDKEKIACSGIRQNSDRRLAIVGILASSATNTVSGHVFNWLGMQPILRINERAFVDFLS